LETSIIDSEHGRVLIILGNFAFGKIKLKKFPIQSLLGLSLLMNMPLLYEPQLIASYLVTNNLPGVWIAWSGMFSLATGLIFFSGLWEKLPIKTENDFSLFRYSGWSAQVLVAFRAVFLGGIINLSHVVPSKKRDRWIHGFIFGEAEYLLNRLDK